MREVSSEKRRGGSRSLAADEDSGSDEECSGGGEGDDPSSGGFHSDSDSTVMMSGNSPFVSKSARYNFLQRSGRQETSYPQCFLDYLTKCRACSSIQECS